MTEKQIGDVISRMSPSRLDCAAKCLAQFYYRYVSPVATDGARAWRLSFGNAMDDAANAVYREKLSRNNEHTPSAKDAADRFAASWDIASLAIDDWEGTDQGTTLDIGVRGAKLWRDNIAQFVEPAMDPQLHIQCEIQDDNRDRWTLHGFVDLLAHVDGHPVIIDLKTSSKRYSESSFASASQPAAYSIILDSPRFSYHVVTTAKNPVTQVLSATISETTQDNYLLRAGMLRRQIKQAYMTGDWLPNRMHMTCKRRYCEQWERCQSDYGGEVQP